MYLFHSCLAAGSNSTTTFTIVNKCSLIVFPAIFHGAETTLPSSTGFSLHPGNSTVLTMPSTWSGSLWGRTHCSHSDGKFSCLTGNCASSTIECNGVNASAPATLAEFNLNATSSGYDFFDVSVVNGYNLAMMVEAQVGNGFVDCMTRGCRLDLNKTCPSELKVMSGGDCIGCSATQPFSKYSEFFTKACPRAKVDASTFQISVCASTDYLITFCPTPTR
ncbi:pathogenesis-related thaumatin protein 3.5 [Trifolium repens]|nr:pathogenesis-related thaumatin protein 3.5 [Trifolium repens]